MIRELATAAFRAALALCPPPFRREYGAAMRADFARAFADERTLHGDGGAIAYAAAATLDLCLSALREYTVMLFRDFSYAVRSLRKTPAFTAVVVATLALAIGANAAIFSILNGSVLAPLPYADSGRLVALNAYVQGAPAASSLPNYADVMRRCASVLSGGAAFQANTMALTGRGLARNLSGVLATPRLFAVLGTRPEIGRFPEESDALPGAARTAVISDALWRRLFGARADALGSLLELDGNAYRVIGVTPPDFLQPRTSGGFIPAEFWTFVSENGAGSSHVAGTDYSARQFNTFNIVARLQPGVPVAAASAAVVATSREIAIRFASQDGKWGVRAVPLDDALVGSARPLLFALFAAVATVLLVACANVANLLLSRAASREREFSVRIAVGASRGRLVAQLLVETFVLAACGGALGIGIAYGVVRAFVALDPQNIPRAAFVTIDSASIAYTFGAVAFCTLAAGLAPAFASSGRDVASALKSAGRGGDGSRGIRARSVLVACEIAMTLALVVSAGLVLRSFIALVSQPLGFDPANAALLGPIDSSQKRFASEAGRAAYMETLARGMRAVPGVRSAEWGYSLPFSNSRMSVGFDIVGRNVPEGKGPVAAMTIVGSGFFDTMHVKVLRGRGFTDDDRLGARSVVVVNETFAKRFFAGGSPIGGAVDFGPGFGAGGGPAPRTIVGVVADIRRTFTKDNDPTIFVPARQFAQPAMYAVVAVRPGTDLDAVARAVPSVDPLQPKPAVASYDALLANDVAVQRLSVAGLSALAFVALALAIAGIFAIVSYGVTQRTHEFGVRMALGADAGRIVATVLGGAMRIAFAGILLGLVIAGVGTRLLGDQLYDTQPLDPLTFGSVTALVVLAALLAALVPARRATRVDPIVALRYE